MQTLSKKKIGITGSMGSGKSKVSEIIRSFDYPVLDLDQVNADLLKKDHAGYQALKKEQLITLDENEEIDKAILAQQMFQDEALKQKVESILHPLIISQMEEWIQLQETTPVFVEVPLLFEANMESLFDSVWCVVVSEETALHRLMKYRGITAEQAKARLQYQMSVQEKMERSQVILYNDGSLEELTRQIEEELEKEKV